MLECCEKEWQKVSWPGKITADFEGNNITLEEMRMCVIEDRRAAC